MDDQRRTILIIRLACTGRRSRKNTIVALRGEFFIKSSARFSHDFLRSRIRNTPILRSLSTVLYRTDTTSNFHIRSLPTFGAHFHHRFLWTSTITIPLTPKIFRNPRIKQLTMAPWLPWLYGQLPYHWILNKTDQSGVMCFDKIGSCCVI